MSVDVPSLALLAILGVALAGDNRTVAVPVAALLLLRLLRADRALEVFERHGLKAGMVLLTIGVLAPLASGKIAPADLRAALTSWRSAVAVLVGAGVAYLGGRGVVLMKDSPIVVTGLLAGTVVGVVFLRGAPVGPLIAAGVVSVVLGALSR